MVVKEKKIQGALGICLAGTPTVPIHYVHGEGKWAEAKRKIYLWRVIIKLLLNPPSSL